MGLQENEGKPDAKNNEKPGLGFRVWNCVGDNIAP